MSGERVAGDSTGCTVIHGEWFAHFNEGLRRASGGDGTPQFTYSLIDLRTYTPHELTQILDTVAPDARPAASSPAHGRIVAEFETIPDAAPPARAP